MSTKFIFDTCPVCGGPRYGLQDSKHKRMLCKNFDCPVWYLPTPALLKTNVEVLTYWGYISDDGIHWVHPSKNRWQRSFNRLGYLSPRSTYCIV